MKTGENLDTETAPVFIGDQQGIGALLHATRPTASNQHQKQHFMIPRLASKVLQPEVLEYLKVKGCFSLPTSDVCNALVEAYFNFVHPLFPIINAREFLERYEQNGIQQINPLLLWSMFSVSASYIPHSILGTSGYHTREQFKENIVKRVRLLFELSAENDKIILIQSSLLLSFWFQDAEDVKQSWCWTGIAISIARTIGLHRNPDGNGKKKNQAIGERQRRNWRNL
jgi:Fungal specific transcription factor domain